MKMSTHKLKLFRIPSKFFKKLKRSKKAQNKTLEINRFGGCLPRWSCNGQPDGIW